jgi:Asp-tRNA(Asn)/Glu-tRNA(Gln) amidotransferase A subunit family amidase
VITPPEMKDNQRQLAYKIQKKLEHFLLGLEFDGWREYSSITSANSRVNRYEHLRNHFKNRVWIMPSLPTPAPHHNESLLRIFDVSNTGFFNVMELPVTAIPLGLTSDQGLPIGLQIISGPGQDALCIAVAKALQRAGVARWMPPKDML